jgi:hypothetical protein
MMTTFPADNLVGMRHTCVAEFSALVLFLLMVVIYTFISYMYIHIIYVRSYHTYIGQVVIQTRPSEVFSKVRCTPTFFQHCNFISVVTMTATLISC